MKKEYDFTNSKKNPYAKALKKQITVRLDETTIEYFKKLAQLAAFHTKRLLIYICEIVRKNKKG